MKLPGWLTTPENKPDTKPETNTPGIEPVPQPATNTPGWLTTPEADPDPEETVTPENEPDMESETPDTETPDWLTTPEAESSDSETETVSEPENTDANIPESDTPDWLTTPETEPATESAPEPTPTPESVPVNWTTPTTPVEETTPEWVTQMLTTPKPTSPSNETQQPQTVTANPTPTRPETITVATSMTSHALVCVLGAKGGIGKTTLAITLADTAVHYGPNGYRVSLIDANRGQADITTYLHLPDTLPTILNTAHNHQPLQQHLTPKTINPHRPGLGNIGYAITLAPHTDLSDPTLTTPQTYLDTINEITLNSNLTIVDTQTVENHDTTGVISKAVIPAILQNAGWVIAVTDTTPTSPKNLCDRIQQLTQKGINPKRMIIVVNETRDNDPATQKTLDTLQPLGIPIIQIPHNPLIRQLTGQHRMATPCPTLHPPVRQILTRVTGMQAFTVNNTPSPTTTTPRVQPRKTGLRGIIEKILR